MAPCYSASDVTGEFNDALNSGVRGLLKCSSTAADPLPIRKPADLEMPSLKVG